MNITQMFFLIKNVKINLQGWHECADWKKKESSGLQCTPELTSLLVSPVSSQQN